MSPFALLSLFRGRGSLYTLLGALLLSTFWVTSLTLISARPNATELLTDVGADVLNPFLAQRALGITAQTYSTLQTQASQHKDQPVALPSLFKVQVLGSQIAGKSYQDGVHVIYGDVASAYYDGGLGAVFTVPPELQQILPSFGIFGGAGSIVPSAPSQPSTDQLPDFLQPFLTVVGLTPATFTAQGHQNLLNLLPWFWLATLVLGGVALVFDRSGNKLNGLAHAVLHSAWPIVLMLGGLWIASLTFYKSALQPYGGALGVVDRAFLPVYGGAAVLGALGLVLPKLLAARQPAREPVPAGVPSRASTPAAPAPFGMPSMPPPSGMSSDMPSMSSMPPTYAAPESSLADPSPSMGYPSSDPWQQSGDQQ